MRWLENRLHFWKESLSLWWFAVVAIWTGFSNAATLRDNFLPPALQAKWATLEILPRWGWKEWSIGLLVIGLVAVLEGTYRRFAKEQAIIAEKEVAIEKLTFPEDFPEVYFARWGQARVNATSHRLDFLQHGFYVRNDGKTASEFQVESFQIGSLIAKSKAIEVSKDSEAFALVWVQGDPYPDVNKFDLLEFMKREASPGGGIYRENHSVSVSAVYRDAKMLWYRSTATLSYVPARHELVFEGGTKHEKLGSLRPS
jgi:hypothetical protein